MKHKLFILSLFIITTHLNAMEQQSAPIAIEKKAKNSIATTGSKTINLNSKTLNAAKVTSALAHQTGEENTASSCPSEITPSYDDSNFVDEYAHRAHSYEGTASEFYTFKASAAQRYYQKQRKK
jgi:hypothetical protein